MDSLLASLESTLAANATLTTLDNDGLLRFRVAKPGNEEPDDIRRYEIVLIPSRRKRYSQLGGQVYRWLEVRIIVWTNADWTDEEALIGRGTSQGLDDICDCVEAALAHSTLSDATLMCPTEDEGISEGEYLDVEGLENTSLLGVEYTYTQRRDLTS